MRGFRHGANVGVSEGGEDMTAFRKDLAATVATALAVLTYVATHEGWDVWLIGDDHRWAAAVITLLGLAVFLLERAEGATYRCGSPLWRCSSRYSRSSAGS